jgi:RNA polymerase subunit RPABC4/transcription elongation factor Spt4
MTLFLLIIIALLIYYFILHREGGVSRLGFRNQKLCPNCHNPVEEQFNICPICKETLKKKCHHCGEKIDSTWKYCPFCEKPVNGSGSR